MSRHMLSICLLVGLIAFKTINVHAVETDGCKDKSLMCALTSLTQYIAKIFGNLANCSDDVIVDKCTVLEDGKQYYLQSADGQFAVVNDQNKLGYVKQIALSGVSKFTAVKKSWGVYGLCVSGFCMSRCNGCPSDTSELNTVRFHLTNSDAPYSQWTLTPSGELFTLKIDDPYGYLIYKKTTKGDNQLTLSTTLSDVSKFKFVKVN